MYVLVRLSQMLSRMVILLCGLYYLCRITWFKFTCDRALRRRPSGKTPSRGRLKLAFVSTWFGANIGGGAESELTRLANSVKQRYPDIEVEVISTTLKEFNADWNESVHPAGCRTEDGITVRRFQPATPGRTHFHFLNRTDLMTGGIESLFTPDGRPRSPLRPWAEAYFIWHMVRSPEMLEYFVEHRDDYDYFIFIPYMFACSVFGSIAVGRKAIIIPCLHEERYVFMQIYRDMAARAGTIMFHVRSEQAFAARVFDLSRTRPYLLGEQVDIDVARGNPGSFRQKFGIRNPFLLFAGRQIAGKNLPLLVEQYREFRKRHPDVALDLVLIGKGDLDYSNVPGVRNLGFLAAPDKTDAYAAALALCLPSLYESFSIVIMESWLQETPVIAAKACAVTRDHCEDSGGGFAVENYAEFEAAVTRLLNDPALRSRMGAAGREYVRRNYSPEIVTKRFVDFLTQKENR